MDTTMSVQEHRVREGVTKTHQSKLGAKDQERRNRKQKKSVTFFFQNATSFLIERINHLLHFQKVTKINSVSITGHGNSVTHSEVTQRKICL